MKIAKEQHLPRYSLELGASLSFEKNGAGPARAEQPAVRRLNQVFMLVGKFLAAHVAAFRSGSLARQLSQRRKCFVLLQWERGRHVSHPAPDRAPVVAVMSCPL